METDLENIVKTGGFLLGFSAAGLATMLGSYAGIIKYFERRHALKSLKEEYKAGRLDRKPTFFNVWSFYGPVERKQKQGEK